MHRIKYSDPSGAEKKEVRLSEAASAKARVTSANSLTGTRHLDGHPQEEEEAKFFDVSELDPLDGPCDDRATDD